MKYYLAIDDNGRKQLRDTQDEIRKVNKTFKQIDLPTDKNGLRELVQESFDHIFNLETQISSVATAEEPEVPAEQVTDAPLVSPVQADSKPPARPSGYLEWSIEIDKIFGTLPLARQLDLAATALERARESELLCRTHDQDTSIGQFGEQGDAETKDDGPTAA